MKHVTLKHVEYSHKLYSMFKGYEREVLESIVKHEPPASLAVFMARKELDRRDDDEGAQ